MLTPVRRRFPQWAAQSPERPRIPRGVDGGRGRAQLLRDAALGIRCFFPTARRARSRERVRTRPRVRAAHLSLDNAPGVGQLSSIRSDPEGLT